MNLVPHWRRVLKRAWSMWCVYIAAALQIAAAVVPYAADLLPWWVPVLVLILAPLARIVSQGDLDADQSHHQQ